MDGLDPDLLGHASIFATVAQTRSFTSAAHRLGLAKSTISHRIRELETALQTRLLERTTRQVRLTEEGTLLADSVTKMLEHWRDGCQMLSSRHREPAGVLRVTAPAVLMDVLVTPLVCELMARHPKLSAELLPDDRYRDLVRDNIDLAIRLGPLEDSSLVARKLGDERGWVAVSRRAEHLVDAIESADPAELGRLPWVGHPRSATSIALTDDSGTEHTLAVRYRSRASTSHGLLSLVVHGAGVGLLPDGVMALAPDALVASRRWHGPAYPLWLVQPSRRHVPARVGVLVAALESRMATPLYEP